MINYMFKYFINIKSNKKNFRSLTPQIISDETHNHV